jgi:hypothetical protein
MLVNIKTPTNLSSQLYRCSKGKEILIGNVSKLDIPLEYFFGGTITQSLEPKTITPFIHCFQSGVDFFLHLPKPKM